MFSIFTAIGDRLSILLNMTKKNAECDDQLRGDDLDYAYYMQGDHVTVSC